MKISSFEWLVLHSSGELVAGFVRREDAEEFISNQQYEDFNCDLELKQKSVKEDSK